MRIRPVVAILLGAFGLATGMTAKAGKLDDDVRRVMPSADYTLLLKSKYRRFFTDSPIDGYVKFLGDAHGDDIVVREVLKTEPSSVDTKTAKVLASRAKVNGGSTSSRLSPSVNVYVFFYNQDKASRLALIYAVPGDGPGNIQGVKNFFVEIVEYQVDSGSKDSKKTTPAAAAKGAPVGS